MMIPKIKSLLFISIAFCIIFSVSVFAIPEINYSLEELSNAEKNATVFSNYNNSDEVQLFSSVFSGGEGTEDNPYLLSTQEDLIAFSDYVNTGNDEYISAHYMLANDINLNGNEWTPVGNYISDISGYSTCFQGVFDGNNKTISNFVITTNDTSYVGFFGYLYNAVIKNISVSDFTINIETDSVIYTGALAGRVLSIGQVKSSSIENCHAINGKIDIKSKNRIYSGGLIGYLHASDNGKQYLKKSSSNTDIFLELSNTVKNTSNRYLLSAGGLLGYVASIDNSITEISASYSTGTISVLTTDVNKAYNNSPHVGGFAGDIGSQDGAKLNISECFSTSGVFLKSDAEIYAGSMFGYVISNSAEITVENSHTNANVYAHSTTHSSYISGFSGIAATQGDSSSLALNNIYSAANVFYTGNKECDGGKITSYTTGNVTLQNCYSLEDSILFIPGDILVLENSISNNNSGVLTFYSGFDTYIWEISSESSYSYPVLKNNPMPDVEYTMYFATEDGKYFTKTNSGLFGTLVVFPENPAENIIYEFSHWSVIPGGSDAADYKISSDTLFFPNYSSNHRIYNIKFIANGDIVDTVDIQYGDELSFPEAPPIPPNAIFTFYFSHWSKSKNGAAIDISSEKVTGETTYYAVYKAIAPHIWDGKTARDFRGSGTETDPYIIKSPYHLYKVSNLVNTGTPGYADAYYLLACDIDLGEYEWTPIGTEENPFTGIFNGDGYKIHSFKITNNNTNYAGVFGYAKDAIITKLKASNFVIDYEHTFLDDNNTTYAGGIVGYIYSSNINKPSIISQCESDGKINIVADYAYSGGIIGCAVAEMSCKLLISNSFSSADIKLDTSFLSVVAGIVGGYNATSNINGGIEYCGFSGKANAVSQEISYSAGICAYISDGEPVTISDDVFQSSANQNLIIIRSCFSVAKEITSSNYAGHIFSYKNSNASISNCYGTNKTKLTALKYASNTNTTLSNNFSKYYNITYLKETVGLDLNNIWTADGESLPVLTVFNQVNNVFHIKTFEYSEENTIFNASFDIAYRNTTSYTVLAAAYDERGKMIKFTAKTISTPTTLKTVDLSILNIEDAKYCTVSVINPQTFEMLEESIMLYK